jgi:hypothetical protein
MSDKIRENIYEFGPQALYGNRDAMALNKDLTGSRHAIIKALTNYNAAKPMLVKRYLMSHAFVSLLDEFAWGIESLQKPKLRFGVRIPKVLVFDRRPYGST